MFLLAHKPKIASRRCDTRGDLRTIVLTDRAACRRKARLSPLGWWEFGDGAEVGGDVQAVSVPVLGWAIA